MSRHALTADSTMILPPLSSSQPIPPTPSPSTFLFSYHSSLLSKRSQQSRLSSYTAHTLTSAQSALLTRPSSPATSRLPLPLHALDAAHYRLCVERELLVRSALSRREQHAAAAHERVQATLRRDRRLDEEHTRAHEREVQRMQQQAAHVLAAECLTAHRAAVRVVQRTLRAMVAVSGRRTAWQALTEREDVDPTAWAEWMTLVSRGDIHASSPDLSIGDRLLAAIAQPGPLPTSPAQTPRPTPAVLASPAVKKGKAKEEVVAAPPPPVQSIPDLLAAYPTSFQHHRDVQTLSLALQPGSAENEAALTEAAKAQYLSNVADLAAGPSFAELVQALQERARGPALPVASPAMRACPVSLALVGRPYAGKRTQAEAIAARFDLHIIALPDLIANALTSAHPIASTLSSLLASSSPLPDDLLVRLVVDAINSAEGAGYLLLSFPATASQARLFTQLTTGYLPSPSSASLPPPSHLRAVIELIVTDDRAARRCLGREVDAQGVEWHREERPYDGDQLGKESLVRVDPGHTLMKRCRDYDLGRPALKAAWEEVGPWRTVDGERSRDEVTDDVCTQLTAILNAPPPRPATPPPPPFPVMRDVEMARLLSEHHARVEGTYDAALSTYLTALRRLSLAHLSRLAVTRRTMRALLHSPTRAAAEVAQYQAAEEDGDAEWDAMKDERHARIDDLDSRLQNDARRRRAEYDEEVKAVRADGSQQSMERRVVRAAVAMAQAEVDRWVGEHRLIRDYFAVRDGGVLADDDRGRRTDVPSPFPPKLDTSATAAAGDKRDKAAKRPLASPSSSSAAAVQPPADPFSATVAYVDGLRGSLCGWAEGDAVAKALVEGAAAGMVGRVERLCSRGKEMVERMRGEWEATMDALVEEGARRGEEEEAEVREVGRWLRGRVEREETVDHMVRGEETGKVGVVVERSQRVRPSPPIVRWSLWERAEAQRVEDRSRQEVQQMAAERVEPLPAEEQASLLGKPVEESKQAEEASGFIEAS